MWRIITFSFFLVQVLPVRAQWYSAESLNLSFEKKKDGTNKPEGWECDNGLFMVDSSVHQDGKYSLRLSNLNSPGQNSFFVKRIPTRLFQGTVVTLNGYIKTDGTVE